MVFTSLPVPADVEAVALGPNGLIEGMKPDTAFFDMSTNSVAVVRKINAAFAEKNLYMLDSPVSGGPGGAASGKMAIWVGGDEQQFNRHKRVLDAMGDQARYIGPIGAGTIAKLVHNCTSAVVGVALAEVMTMGIKAGVEPLELWEAVRQGATGRQRTFDRLGKFLSSSYDPADFALRLLHKDVSLAVGLGREVGVPMRLANLALEELTEAMNRGWEQRDSRVGGLLQVERAKIPPLECRPGEDPGGARQRPAECPRLPIAVVLRAGEVTVSSEITCASRHWSVRHLRCSRFQRIFRRILPKALDASGPSCAAAVLRGVRRRCRNSCGTTRLPALYYGDSCARPLSRIRPRGGRSATQPDRSSRAASACRLRFATARPERNELPARRLGRGDPLGRMRTGMAGRAPTAVSALEIIVAAAPIADAASRNRCWRR